jgi:mycothiol synthase
VNLDWRPLAETDIPACSATGVAIDAVDGSYSGTDEGGLRELIATDRLDLAGAGIGAFSGDAMLAYGIVGSPEPRGDVRQARLHGGVHPDHRGRGVGHELLGRLVEQGSKLHGAADMQLVSGLVDTNERHRRLLERHGFHLARRFTRMSADLPASAPAIPVPGGLEPVRLGGLPPELDEAIRHAFNRAFADHWDSPAVTEHVWQTSFTGSAEFLPGLSQVLLDPATGEVASFVLAYTGRGKDVDGMVYIGDVGTLRAWRGRGLASTLLRMVLGHAADAGYRTAELSVDSANPTGAFGVYERCGFVVSAGWSIFARATL